MNREVVLPGGAGIYPLQGDVQSTAGSNTVTVSGFLGVALQTSFLASGQVYQYVATTNTWVATLQAATQVNGVTVSDDPWMSVNTAKPVKVNGA